MSTNTIRLCSECGHPLAPDALLGLCPECMMKAGLASPAGGTLRVAPDAFVESPETETREFVPGTKLGYFGDYELVEEIARGGMGVVYKARQSSLKRIVAVKMIRSGGLADETEVARFRTEAQAAAQLQHPNIVAIHEIGEHEGRQYFSMDFVEGKNLAQISGGRPAPPQSAALWLKAITGAVQFAHQRGVLHRDLKPQNIMVDAEGRPHVTDFGLAKMLAGDSSLTRTNAVMGSPSYMSPEQACGRNDLVGTASDVYSLGAVLYELLTGRPPFHGKTLVGTLTEVVNDEPRPPRSLNPGAPVDLETICLKCLEKEPGRRYPTARELELDLGRFLAGEPVQAQPASALRKTVNWFRRHRALLNAVLSVLILTLTGLAYGLWEQTRFLTWLNAHPGFVKAYGPRAAALNGLPDIIFPLVLVGPVVSVFYRKFATGAPWNQILEPLTRRPSLGVTAAFGAIYVAGIGYALYLTAKLIEVTVWEGLGAIGPTAYIVPGIFYGCFSALLAVVRHQTQTPVVFDQEENVLSPAQLASIQGALAAGKIQEAVKRYRAATKAPRSDAQKRVEAMARMMMTPQQLAAVHEAIFAGRTEDAANLFGNATRLPALAARLYTIRMARELHLAHPEKFSRDVPDLFQSNPAYITWFILGVLILAGLWKLLLPHHPLSWLLMLLAGVVWGAWIRYSPYVKPQGQTAFRKIFVKLFITALPGGFASWIFLLAHEPKPNFGPPLICGLVVGLALVHHSLRKRKAS